MFRGIFSPPKNATTDGGFVALNLTSASKLQEVDSSPLSSAFSTPSSEFEANAILAADAPTVEYIDLDSKTILKSPSFPDWYFHFRVQFSRGSEARKTYCMIPLEDFRARLSGSCEEIEKVVETLDSEFHHGFYKLLSNVLSKDDDRFFSRQFVEDNFYDIVEKYYKEDGFNTGEPRNDKIIRGTTVYPVDQTYHGSHEGPAHFGVQENGESGGTFLGNVMEEGLVEDGTIAQDETQLRTLWNWREGIPEASTAGGGVYKYDVSIPLADLYGLVEAVSERLEEAGMVDLDDESKPVIKAIGYGHIGDGNLHLNVCVREYNKEVEKVFRVNTSVMNREKDTTLVTRIKGREVVSGSTTLRKRTSYTETRINE